MTAATVTAPTARRVPVTPVSTTTALRSEWIKLSTLRSTWLTLAFAVLGTIVVGAGASWAEASDWSHMHPDELAHFSAIDDSLTGVQLAQLAIGVLGVLVVTGEYATGMIRTSLAAVPRRLPVLTAKVVVFAVMTAIAMTVAVTVAFFVGQAFLGTHGTTIGAPHALRSVLGASLYLTVVALLAVAIGFVVRSTAGGIAGIVALLLVVPVIGDVLPTSWQPHLLPYLPSNAGAALFAVHTDQTSTLSPFAAFVTLVVWTVLALAAAARVLTRRDA